MGDFNLKFREMTDDEFKKFFELSVLDYSRDLVKSGMCSEEKALESAENQIKEFLPEGKQTKNNSIYITVNSDNEDVGTIWYNKYNESVVFICDFLIYEKFRKKGYGKQTLLLLENEVKEKGFKKIMLHVFKYNVAAFSLYSFLGYKIIKEEGESIHMLKDLDSIRSYSE